MIYAAVGLVSFFYFLEHVTFGEIFFCSDLGWDQIAMTCDNFNGGGVATILAIPS